MRLATAHDTDVAHGGAQCAADRGHVELRVVGENAHGVARAEHCAALVEERFRPRHEHLVGHREASPRGEHFARVADHDVVAEQLGGTRECRREVDRTEDPHAGRRGEGVDEHPHGRRVGQILGRGFAARPVVAHAGAAGFDFAERIAGDDAIEFVVAERADGICPRGHQQMCTHVRPVDHRDQRDRRIGPQARGEPVVDRHHQSSGSRNRWMMPPHVRPTAKASSSE